MKAAPVDFDPFVQGALARTVPSTEAQREIWSAAQMGAEASCAFNQALCLSLSGLLEIGALQSALQDLVDRHEALRGTFTPDGSSFCIATALRVQMPVVNLSDLDRREREVRLADEVSKEVVEPFDLVRGPLLRARLIRLGKTEHVVLLTAHHLVCDGWSVGVLLRELAQLYSARRQGVSSSLGQAPSFTDYANAKDKELRGATYAAAEQYWLSRFEDGVPALELPTQFQRPLARSFRAAREDRVLSPAVVAGLRTLAGSAGCSQFVTLLAALDVFLYRLSGQEDVVVGIPAADQPLLEHEDLVGHCVSLLPLRLRLNGEHSFRDCLKSARAAVADAFDHRPFTFGTLVRKLRIPRDPGRIPLASVMLNVDRSTGELRFDGLETRCRWTARQFENFELHVNAVEDDAGLALECTYNADLFDAALMRQRLEEFETLLASITADPERAISRLSLVPEAERRRLLVEWNDTRTAVAAARCVHELFEAQVERTPDAEALVAGRERLTYRELNRRANQLAHQLRAMGVGPDVLVGLCLERSAELLVAILGILKAGGAYVPLDPAYPAERLAFMLADSRAAVVVTQDRVRSRLPQQGGGVLCVDDGGNGLAGQLADNPAPTAAPTNLAYVIYTSGSTGRPKGVMVEHRNVVNLFAAMDERLGRPSGCVWLAVTSLSFDIAVLELLWPLARGFKVVLADGLVSTAQAPDESGLRAADSASISIATLLERHGVTHLQCTPSAARLLTADPETRTALRSLERLLVGGETLPIPLAAELRSLVRGDVINMYGPTETTVWSSCHTVTDADDPVPIGRPIANTELYILDGQRQPVSVGVTGELFIGGNGVVRGYLHDPERTAQRFERHPFSGDPAARVFRTGDLAKYRHDGCVLFLGRTDYQVKLRGHRIELGEIEAVLTKNPAVREAVVVLREDRSADQRLVAYWVPSAVQSISPAQLRAFLQERLPAYMVPQHFVPLQALPRSPNGKVDRRGLPPSEQEAPVRGDGFVGPRSPTEDLLAEIWSEVLGIQRVGIHDDFFELGGHSLLATQVVARIRHALELEFPLGGLFEAPTVAGMARALEALRRSGAGVPQPPLRRGRPEGPVPLSFAQQRLWFLNEFEPSSAAYNIPMAFRLTGNLDRKTLERALGTIVERHEVLRTRFEVERGVPWQVIASAGTCPLTTVDLTMLAPDEREAQVARVARAEAQRPFDLARGPLLRAQLLRLADTEHVLLLTLHHIVSDGWSLGVFYRELAALYEAFRRGEPSPLAPLPIQYADYTAWQRQWLQGEVLERQVGYWRERLAGAPAVLELPTDHPRPAVQTNRGAIETFSLPRALLGHLQTLSRREGVTLNMTLLAAFKVLLARYTGQTDLVVGSPIAGRTHTELEGLIGFFVNTLVLRTDLSGDPSFREVLARVRQTALEAYAHQDLPFEKLVEELAPERSLSHAPLFQVMITLQALPGGTLELPGLTLSSMEFDGGTTKFDLTLFLREGSEGLSGVWEYSTDLFEAATLRRWTGHWQTLLEGIVQHPEQRVSELPVLTAAERRQVVVEWNATAAEYPRDRSLAELFEAQVERTPGAEALVAGQERLTYRELNRRANQLAHRLRAMGVGPDVLVGLCMERSAELLVAILGILKAGGAYVPLDPAYPKERLAFMLTDSRAPVIVTQDRVRSRLPEQCGEVLCVDGGGNALAGERAENPAPTAAPNNLAYVIYTSGSTGRPKGVAIEHRSTVAFLTWAHATFGREQLAGVLASTSVCFDVSAFELFTPLTAGGKVILADHALALPGLAAASEVTLVSTVPAAMAELVRTKGLPRSAWTVCLAGEPLTVALVREIYEATGVQQVYDLYGPTESTTYATWALRRGEGPYTIGRPIANTQVYLLDARGQPVPIGVPGELCLGGAGLARGYLNRPELTAERFVANPFGAELGARLYRTGDRARYLPDGNLELLGRLDHQVKVRGYRIELGEIEAVLTKNPAVREAVVLVREDRPADQRLVAYWVPSGVHGTPPAELRAFLRERLPAHMVPQHFVRLQALPRSPNGKVDRRALPRPEQEADVPGDGFVAPRSPTERVLAEIWREALAVERVGIYDSFFDLGGHSLLAMTVIDRVRERTGHRLAPVDFARQTLGQLAAACERAARGAGGREPAPWLRRVLRTFKG